MSDVVRVRLELETKGAAASAREVAENIRRSLGSLKIDNNVIDLSNSRKQVQDLVGDILKVNAALKGSGASAQGLQKELAIYKEMLRFKRQLAQIDANAITPEGAANARALATELNRLNLQKINQDFQGLSANATTGLQKITLAAGAVGAAIGGLFLQGLQEFTEFDGAIRQSGAVAGATEGELKALSDEVTRLGSSTTKAPAEIARMSTELARAGFTSEETTAALEGIVFASEATGESLSTVGDIIAKTLRVFNKSATESGEVADLLVQTANSTNTSVGGLGDSLRYVGQQAASSDQELESILIALGLLGDAGIQGTQAGTNLAEALNRLKIASAGSVTQFQGLVRGQKGATAAFEAIGAQVRDADGNLKQITEIIPIVRSQLQGLAKEDQDVLLRALFGAQGGRAFGTLLNSAPDRIAEVTAAVENAQNVAGETSERLRQGLSGAVSLFQGTSSTFLKEFGQIAAVPVEPVVRAATELLGVFNNLPAPIQAALVATTGFVGVLAAATAAIAAYNLANGALIKTQIEEAAATVGSTVATQGKNLAMAAAQAGELAWALATRTATEAQRAQVAAIGANAAKFGLLAAAIGSVTLAVNEYNQSTQSLEGTQEAIDSLAESTVKLKEAFADAAEGTPDENAAQLDAIATNIESVRDGFSQVDKILEAIREKIGLIPDPLREVVAAFNPVLRVFGDGTTRLETILNNQSIEFEDFRQDIEKNVLAPYEELLNKPGGLESATPEQLATVRASIDTAIAGLEDVKETTPEAAAAVDAYRKTLSNAAAAIDSQRDSQIDLNEETAEGTDKIGEQIKALEAQQKAAAEASDDARADSERQISRQLDDERRQRQQDNEEELAQIQEANADRIAQIEKQNAAEISAQERADALAVAEIEKQQQAQLQETELAFEQEISDFEEQRQAGLQAKEQAFQRSQQQQEAAFNEQQRAIEQAFQDQQRQRNEAQGESFDDAERLINLQSASTREQRETILQQQRAIDRVEQLNLADQILSPERISELARQVAEVGSSIDNEDEARRTQEALGLIRAEQQRQQQEADRLAEQQLQAQLQAQEAKFQQQQEQRRAAFETAIATQRQQLEAEIEARKLAFEEGVLTPLREEQETRIAEFKAEQEANLATLREQQELELQSLREQQETDLEARRRAFEDSERALDRAYEDQKLERDRQYRAEQRRLDEESARRIEAIRSSNRSTPQGATRDAQGNDISFTPRSLRKGGSFEAGEILRVHKDEYILPPIGGTVLNQRDSKAIAREAIASNPHLIAANLRRGAGLIRPSIARPTGSSVTDQKILKQLERLNSQVSKLGRPNDTTNLNVSTTDQKSALKERARQLSNELSRRG